ncbi:MAG: sigma-54-dependent Fis family transcriptional regulator [Acidobacteria bacterium]|nr:sigma-54-dependent Fis family transcriptional regulator [Acidobacteriota bacterium]
MIESIKARLWDSLKEKEVSLAMIYSCDGRILWHKGRDIAGKTVAAGEGFSKSCIERSLAHGGMLEKDNAFITVSADALPQSARTLHVKSLIIQQIDPDLFLYVDSGIRDAFAPADRDVFTVIGRLLAESIRDIKTPAGGLSGASPAMARVRDLIARYSLEEEPVLLRGETGVGKNHVAELIHRFSGRTGPFVTVCAPAIPESLFESEVFGHRRGAFTGALETREGLVETARKGTLFLDEIGDVPLTFQAKLLQLIETQRYRVLGDPVERTGDVRIVAATNRNLEDDVGAKRFRADLYFRLNVLPIEIAPLRERKEDIRALILENERLLRGKRLTDGSIAALLEHAWPGNVRELLHVLKRAGIQLECSEIGEEQIRVIVGDLGKESASGAGEIMEQVRVQIAAGRSFWETAWEQFMNRDLSRGELKAFLESGYAECGQSLKKLCTHLNIEDADYPRFVSALHKYDIHPKVR